MKKDTFVKGAYIATICVFIAKILGIIYVIPFYSIIGEQGGALYGYAYNIYSIFLAISTAGIPTAVSKLISEYDAEKKIKEKNQVFSESLKILTIISFLAFLVLIIFSKEIAFLIIGNATGGNSIEDISLVIKCISLAILIVPLLSVTRGLLQGHKYITPTSKSEIIEQFLRIGVLLIGSFIVIKLMNKSITTGVAVSVLGAFVGALGAYFYLFYIIKKNKIIKKEKNKDKKINNEIRRKIVKYSIPLIIVSVVLAIYNFSDMVITLRVMTGILGIDTLTAENTISLYTTWGEKFQRIIAACATGVGISLIPNMVRAYVKKEYKSVENIIIKALELVIFVGLPLTILISIFSSEVWSIFYGYNKEGITIISYSIFIGLLSSLSTIGTTALQAMNKFKNVYLSIIIGVVLNALLDTPLILIFNFFGFNPCYGSITASVFGFGTTLLLSLYFIKKECKISYRGIFKTIKKMSVPILSLILISFGLKYIIGYNNFENRILTIIVTAIYFSLPLTLYIVLTYKNKLLTDLFSEGRINKLLKRGDKNV
ncbi:MAG: polysaccharide biosynthesis protein [Bacilli bacterium]|nr:polysaccharide biosynthesis protein [Bacilli bacterium]